MRQHLEGRGGGTLAQAAAGDGAQATPRPHGSPALPDVAQSREKPPGQPPEARAGQSGSPLRPAPGIPSHPATSLLTTLSPPNPPARPGLTRLGHRRSLSSVSLRAIAYSLTSSDTPTI